MKIAIVIPAFNAAKTIEKLLGEVSNYISLKNVIVIDDGSIDNTSELAKQCGAVCLSHEVNSGKGAALLTGFRFAQKKYDAVITMDADCQHPPKDIPGFINFYENNGVDLIIGTRMSDVGEMPLIRYLTNRTTSLVLSIVTGEEISDSQSGYRLISTKVLRNIKLVTRRYDTESEILIRAGKRKFSFGEIPIESIYTGEEVSYINNFSDTFRFISLIIKSWWW